MTQEGNGKTPEVKILEKIHETLQEHTSELKDLRLETRSGFVLLDQRLATVDGRLATMDGRLATMDERLATMDERLGTMDARLGTMDERLAHVDARLERIDERIDKVVVNTGSHWRDLERRVTILEEKIR